MNNNLKTVQEIYAAFGQGDIPTILEKLDDNVQWETWEDNTAQKAGVPYLQARIGKQGAIEFFQCIGTEIKINDFRVSSIMDGGNNISAIIDIGFEVVRTSKMLKDEEMHLWSFNDAGKVTRLRHYLDTKKHIDANQ